MSLELRIIQPNEFARGERIAVGPGARIYKGTWERSDKPVAIKVWYAVNLKETLKEEYDLAGIFLSHPNLLAVHGVCTTPGKFADVTELMHTSLAQKLKGLNLRQIYCISSGIGCGLSFLHLKGFIHKHLTPTNVLLSEDLLTVKLSDAGRTVFKAEMKRAGYNQMDSTIRYRAPETFTQGYNKLDTTSVEPKKQADVYSEAMLLWAMLAGREPFAGDKEAVVTTKLIAAAKETIPRCTKPHADLIEKCWKVSGERPSAAEFEFELKNANEFVESTFQKVKLASNVIFSEGQLKDIYSKALQSFLWQLLSPELCYQPPINESQVP
ncbi:MAG: protein kinase [Parachlamydiales bacterium]